MNHHMSFTSLVIAYYHKHHVLNKELKGYILLLWKLTSMPQNTTPKTSLVHKMCSIGSHEYPAISYAGILTGSNNHKLH